MNPLEQIGDIESRLNEGAIDVQHALADIFAGPKPWHTPWWKEQRLARLGLKCATCGTSDPPLVLQHTWHPMTWKDALRTVGPPNWEWWKQTHPLPKLVAAEPPPIERPTCPVCGSTTVRFRKTRNEWDCEAGLRGTLKQRHEGATFPQPKIALCPDKDVKRSVKEVVSVKYQLNSNTRWQAWLQSPECKENHRLAILLLIIEKKRYLSFVDTKTLCKSCAATEDCHRIRRHERDAYNGALQQMVDQFGLIE